MLRALLRPPRERSSRVTRSWRRQPRRWRLSLPGGDPDGQAARCRGRVGGEEPVGVPFATCAPGVAAAGCVGRSCGVFDRELERCEQACARLLRRVPRDLLARSDETFAPVGPRNRAPGPRLATETSEAEARPPRRNRFDRYCRGPHDLGTFEELQRILGRSLRGVTIDVRRGDFPALVMSFPRGRFWLREHVEAYAAGRRWTQEANERLRDSLPPQYLTGPETEKLTGVRRGDQGTVLAVARLAGVAGRRHELRRGGVGIGLLRRETVDRGRAGTGAGVDPR